MYRKKRTLIYKVVALLLIFTLVFPIGANAIEPRASDYLDSYNAYPYASGLGKIQIWFNVKADDYMDDLGALTIQIYESTDNSTWSWVETYRHTTDSSMLGHDDIFYQSHIEHQGTIGRYYKAYVCIWAGKDGDGDTRYFWTSSQKATLFAQAT